MQDVATKDGRTVLFVSHNMAAVGRLCQTVLLLEKGSVVAHGDTASVIAKYLQTDAAEKSQYIPDPAKSMGNDTVILLGVAVKGDDGNLGPSFASSAALKVEISYRLLKPAPGLRIGFHLNGADGTIVFNASDTDNNGGDNDGNVRQTGNYKSSCEIPAEFLNRGQYSISVGSDSSSGGNFFLENIISFLIVPDNRRDGREDNRPGLVCPRLSWTVIAIEMDHSTEMPESIVSI